MLKTLTTNHLIVKQNDKSAFIQIIACGLENLFFHWSISHAFFVAAKTANNEQSFLA